MRLMGVPTSEVGYTSATNGRGDHEVPKELEKKLIKLVKVIQSHYRLGQAQMVSRRLRHRFQDNRHMKVIKSSAPNTGHLQPHEIFLVLISVRE
jgi:hypothetical protein